jgi:very-short-patch-repair endonuclease
MTEQDFLKLIRFYIACIETEDRKSLTKELSKLHHSLVSPWEENEPLFNPGASDITFQTNLSSDRTLLLGGAALAGGPERFFYGYPVFLDEKGFLSPLFVVEVEVDHQGDDCFVLHPIDKGEIQLNHHIFQRQHTQAEELRAIQEELEGEYGSFADRLRAAFEALGISTPGFSVDQLEPFPSIDSPRNRWVNRPILFKSERSSYTYHLRRELEALVEYPRLHSTLGSTAVGVIAGITSAAPQKYSTQGNSVEQSQLIQVVPLNTSQEKAARASLTAPITVVTGPPGTGKSQLVVDILASCAYAGKPVLFASKNNKAVDVVRDRLHEILGEKRDWTLRFGNRDAMEKAHQEMGEQLDVLKTGDIPPAPSPIQLNQLDEQIAEDHQQIEELERVRTEYSKLEREHQLAEGMVEPGWIDAWSRSGSPTIDSIQIKRLNATAEDLGRKIPNRFWLRLRKLITPKSLHRKMLSDLQILAGGQPSQISEKIQNVATQSDADQFVALSNSYKLLLWFSQWYIVDSRCRQTLEAIGKLQSSNALADHLNDLQSQRAGLACDQLRAAWTGRLASHAINVKYSLDNYFNLSSRLRQSRGSTFFHILEQYKGSVKSLASDLPIWVVTNLSVENALPLEPNLFDLVIIDEASQCDIPSAIPLLFRSRHALIIGDPHQLCHISTLNPSEEQNLANQYDIGEFLASWSYNQRSLYLLAEGIMIERGTPPIFLAEHYRSHPEIIDFSNRMFYQGQLILRTPLKMLNKRMGEEPLGLFWHDVRGEVPFSSRSAVNEIEVRAVISLLGEWARTGFLFRNNLEFGIVTPFKLQMDRLEAAVRGQPWWGEVEGRLKVGTAHRFQGDECDVMILSPVVSAGMLPRLTDWVSKTDQLLNVAITRARCALHVVGDEQACMAAGGKLSEFVASTGGSNNKATVPAFESPAETRMAEILTEIGLWYSPQYSIGRFRLDFLVVSPFGTRYDLEVDGRGHLTDGAISSDEIRDASVKAAGLKVLRIDARRIFRQEETVREILQHII